MKKVFLCILAIASLAVSAWAVPLINCNSGTVGSNTVVSATATLSFVGDSFFIFASESAASQTVTLSDSGTPQQTYVQQGSYFTAPSMNGAIFLIASASSSLAGQTMTATWTGGSAALNLIFCEVHPTLGSLDGSIVTSSNIATTNTQTSGNLTTTNTGNDVDVFCVAATGSISGIAFTNSFVIPSSGSATRTACAYLSATGPQTNVNSTASWTSNFGGIGAIFAIEQTGGSGSGSMTLLGVGQ